MAARGLSRGPAILPPFPPCMAGFLGRSRWTELAAPYFLSGCRTKSPATNGQFFLLLKIKDVNGRARPGHDVAC